jgi:hypothetical protein
MTKTRRSALRRMAIHECADIIESAIGTDLGVFQGLTKEEADFVDATMRKVSDRLFARAEVKQ